MPPAKKRKTGKDASAPTKEKEPESATPHKNDESKDGEDEGRDVSFFASLVTFEIES